MHVSSTRKSAICAFPQARRLRCTSTVTRACYGNGDGNGNGNPNKTPPPSPRDKSNVVARKRFNAFLCRVDRHARPLGESLVQFVQSTATEDVEHLKQAIQDMCVDESIHDNATTDGPDRGWFVDIDDASYK